MGKVDKITGTTAKKRNKKREITYTFIEENEPSPEAVRALHAYMLKLMKEKRTAGLI
jgi:hypothetical protein